MTLLRNMTGAAFLQRRTLSAIASDAAAGWQAAVVVTLAAGAHVIGGARIALTGGWSPLFSIIPSLPWEFALWLGGATTVSLVAQRLLGIPLGWRTAVRVLGFAFVPCLLNIWMTTPQIPWIMEGWRLAIALVVVDQLLDTTKTKKVLTFFLGIIGAFGVAVLVTIPIFYGPAMFLGAPPP